MGELHLCLEHRSKQLNITMHHNCLTTDWATWIQSTETSRAHCEVLYVLVIKLLSSVVNKTDSIPPTRSRFLQPLRSRKLHVGAGVVSCGAKLLSLLQVIKQSREACWDMRTYSVCCINLGLRQNRRLACVIKDASSTRSLLDTHFKAPVFCPTLEKNIKNPPSMHWIRSIN